jgi:KaiC/GvpD/RAD55 family RecA-like ATPase
MVMRKVEKLENEVQQLNPDELAAFRDWFRRYDSDEWDKEIERDVSTGRLDKLAEEAVAAHKAGRTIEI